MYFIGYIIGYLIGIGLLILLLGLLVWALLSVWKKALAPFLNARPIRWRRPD